MYAPFEMKIENSILAIDGLSYGCQYIQYFEFMEIRGDSKHHIYRSHIHLCKIQMYNQTHALERLKPMQYPYTFVGIYGTFCGLRVMPNKRNNRLYRIYVGCVCFKCSGAHFRIQINMHMPNVREGRKWTNSNLYGININFIVIATTTDSNSNYTIHNATEQCTVVCTFNNDN